MGRHRIPRRISDEADETMLALLEALLQGARVPTSAIRCLQERGWILRKRPRRLAGGRRLYQISRAGQREARVWLRRGRPLGRALGLASAGPVPDAFPAEACDPPSGCGIEGAGP